MKLFLDLGTKTGYAIFSSFGEVVEKMAEKAAADLGDKLKDGHQVGISCHTPYRTAEEEARSPRLASGTMDFTPKRYEGGGMRYLRFERQLMEIGKPDEVYYEEVRRHNSTDAAHVYGGLMATLTKFCEERSIPYSGVPVGTIKKFVTGKGNANKDAVIAAVKARGYAPGDDNEADAIALALTVLGGGV